MNADPRGRNADWVTLGGGVRVSRRWMREHTPQLLTAWCQAPTERRRHAVAALILRIAADLASAPTADGASDEAGAASAWRATVTRIDRRLPHGPDWLPLAAALIRAAATGYDVAARLPALAAAAPLPDRHPARELHWRLLDACPAALPNTRPGGVHNRPGDPQLSADQPPAGRGEAASDRTRHRHGEGQP